MVTIKLPSLPIVLIICYRHFFHWKVEIVGNRSLWYQSLNLSIPVTEAEVTLCDFQSCVIKGSTDFSLSPFTMLWGDRDHSGRSHVGGLTNNSRQCPSWWSATTSRHLSDQSLDVFRPHPFKSPLAFESSQLWPQTLLKKTILSVFCPNFWFIEIVRYNKVASDYRDDFAAQEQKTRTDLGAGKR
jgi:hypothetical protein